LGLLQKIFGKTKEALEQRTQFRLLGSWDTSFSPYDGNQWNISHVRAAVDAFARNAAKVTPRHIRRGGGTFEDVSGPINRLLQTRPNPYMTAFAFYYKLAACYKLTNNAFCYPVWDDGQLAALYPIMAQLINLVEYKGELYCEMTFATGARHVVPYADLIHIRGHFYDNDIFGSDNRALQSVLGTADAFNKSMGRFAELISVIRGVLRFSTQAKSEDLNARRDEFVRDNMLVKNNGTGIVVTDTKYDFTPTQDKQTPIPTGQLEYIKTQVYDYFGVNKEIIQNTFNEQQWNAFYEGELEPFFIQLAQAMTNALFTERERGHGNEIICEANRLQYASIASKIAAINALSAIGVLTVDQSLEIFNMAPIGGEEGARRVQSLNFVNAAKADQYQLGKKEQQEQEGDSHAEDSGQGIPGGE
jgi:HK97 family phage portal protein